MKILVLSDSHGSEMQVYEIMADNTDTDIVIHLGDGEDDLDLALRELPAFGNKRVIHVKGNCDLGSPLPESSLDNIGDYRFFCTHGHRQRVKSGKGILLEDALELGRNVVLFGHTHEQFFDERQGVYMFNPGSAANLEYGVITINYDGSIEFEHFSKI